MARQKINLQQPSLFPEIEAERKIALANRELLEIGNQVNSAAVLNRESLPPRSASSVRAIDRSDMPSNIESLASYVLKSAYKDDMRVASFPSKQLVSKMIATFSADLANEPLDALFRIAAKPLFFEDGEHTAKLIYALASHVPECLKQLHNIREAMATFVEQFERNSRNFVADNYLIFNSARELSNFFRDHPLA